MGKSIKQYLVWSVIGVVVLIAVVLLVNYIEQPNPSVNYDSFVKCLKEKGAVFYGAFWCPVCKKQKEMFGKSAKSLSYVECSTSDGKGQLQACKDRNIRGYPTWVFKDGSRELGELKPERLSEKTNCPLPE